MSPRASGSDVIDKTIEVFEKKVEAEEKEAEFYRSVLEKLRWLRTLKESQKLNWKDVQEAMTLTCYDNLAFCCGPSKECPYQFSVLEALGIDPNDFAEFKVNAINKYLKKKLGSKDEFGGMEGL